MPTFWPDAGDLTLRCNQSSEALPEGLLQHTSSLTLSSTRTLKETLSRFAPFLIPKRRSQSVMR